MFYVLATIAAVVLYVVGIMPNKSTEAQPGTDGYRCQNEDMSCVLLCLHGLKTGSATCSDPSFSHLFAIFAYVPCSHMNPI